MEGLTKQQFFEECEHERDIAKIMADYIKQFNERLTTDIYQHYINNTVMEEDEDD